VIEDLFAFREKVLAELTPGRPENGRLRVGIPRAMSMLDQYPFWHRYLTELNADVVLSPVTDPRTVASGIELAHAQPCFPIQVAHGHALALLESGVDYLLVPNVLDVESEPGSQTPAHLCPWNQTLPYVQRAAPQLEQYAGRMLIPTVHFQLGAEHVKSALADLARRLGAGRRVSDAAVTAAYRVQREFQDTLLKAGHQALKTLDESEEPGVVLLGRSYNLYDRSINCDIPRKLRRNYGANVIPLDFLATGRESIDDLHPNMFWASGRKIMQAARIASARPNLHLVYISNFKCGPDSYIKHFTRQVAGAPVLVLQFDGHGNDAGYLTRCEAYLDSKGILRCYKPSPSALIPSLTPA
jgi:predicted nucleotide-binding protein (sugar kinase/HSP70/actin superfamily)